MKFFFNNVIFLIIMSIIFFDKRQWEESRLTLTRLHVHVGPRAVIAHGLPLAHIHLPLWLQALWGGHSMVIRPHGAMAASRHVHGATGYAGCLVGPRALYGHVVWTCRSRQSLITFNVKRIQKSYEEHYLKPLMRRYIHLRCFKKTFVLRCLFIYFALVCQ